jgi:hypothetical protein
MGKRRYGCKALRQIISGITNFENISGLGIVDLASRGSQIRTLI